MTLKNYQAISQRILNSLNQEMSERDRKRIPPEKEYTYSNGYTVRISALFVDIRNSTELFADNNRDMVTRIIRSFTSETLRIMKTDDCKELGVRGDCVYGIYSTHSDDKVCQVFDIARNLNTLMVLLNKQYTKKGYPKIKIGIGLATHVDLVIKARAKGTGVSSRIWIGEAVTMASNLSKYGNKEGISPIVMSDEFYKVLSNDLSHVAVKSKNLKQAPIKEYECYHCNVFNKEFKDWIDKTIGR